MIHTIHTEGAPRPAGHYSQATVFNDLVFVAGQLAISPDGTKHPELSVAEQARLTLSNVEAILKRAGSGLHGLLQVTIYVTDVADWGAVNAVYAEMLGEHRPARAIVPVKDLNYGLKIEIQAIAARV